MLSSDTHSKTSKQAGKKLEDLFNAYFFEKYKFEDFISIEVQKEIKQVYGDVDRPVYGCSEKLKNFHRFLNVFIFSKLKISEDVVFSYRQGKNVVDAVIPHAESKYFFKTDIERFFPSVTAQLIKETITKSSESLGVTDLYDYIDLLVYLVTINSRLPIGFSTSPIVSNACMYEFDKKILEYSNEKDMVYTRYADDIIISSELKFDSLELQGKIASILSEDTSASFRLNVKKTKILSKASKVKMLGVVILPSGKITVDIQIKNKVESMIYFYLNDKEKLLKLSDMPYESTLSNLSGLLNHINTIDKTYLDKLRMKYGNAVVDMFFHKSVK
ncbi:reverse transcriptase domain-containing protein [Serratia fonticola]|uniref:reverse transcriptase domain-containing protein n=1 Tax=Serratia fonticola TaxID=47917 RepID=UPI0034C6A72F